MRFFNQFDVSRESLTHADLLRINALALAARRDVEATVTKLDESTVRIVLPSGRAVVASDWDNIQSAIVRA